MSLPKKTRIKIKKVTKNLKLGKILKGFQCCREIRLCCMNCIEGEILKGFNTHTEEFETYVVIKNNEDFNNVLLQEILK